MPENPKDYRYLESHEWHKKEADGTIAIGVTQHAAEELLSAGTYTRLRDAVAFGTLNQLVSHER